MRGELAKLVSRLAARAADYKPIWGSVENVLRRVAREQLEGSRGPYGRSYKPLKASTLAKKNRRSSRPYDLEVRKTWNKFAQRGGGTITRGRNRLEVKISTKGAFYVGGGTKYMPPRPVGPSEEAADEISEIIAEYLVSEEKQARLPGIF